MFEYKLEFIGDYSKKLVVFLHGYNGNLDDHAEAIDWLRQYLHNYLLCLPLAPEICDKNPSKRQWFGMIKHDNNMRRYAPETSVTEIMEIYSQTADDIAFQAININYLIEALQKKYNVPDEKIFIIGFSQGAMLALYSGLSTEKKYGGIFMLSGLIAGREQLKKQIKSYPMVYLFHGEKDNKVQYKTLEFTNNWLSCCNIPHEIFTYSNLAHKICKEEIIKIKEILEFSSEK